MKISIPLLLFSFLVASFQEPNNSSSKEICKEQRFELIAVEAEQFT